MLRPFPEHPLTVGSSLGRYFVDPADYYRDHFAGRPIFRYIQTECDEIDRLRSHQAV